MYKCHGVGRNRFRAGKLFRDFLQSPCFIEGKNLSLEKLKWLTKDYWIPVTVKARIQVSVLGEAEQARRKQDQTSETITTIFWTSSLDQALCSILLMLWTTESSQLGMVGVIIYLQGQLHGLESTGGTGRPPFRRAPRSVDTILKFLIIYQLCLVCLISGKPGWVGYPTAEF